MTASSYYLILTILSVAALNLVSRCQTAFFRFYLWWRKMKMKMKKSGIKEKRKRKKRKQVLKFYHLKTRHCVITVLLQVS